MSLRVEGNVVPIRRPCGRAVIHVIVGELSLVRPVSIHGPDLVVACRWPDARGIGDPFAVPRPAWVLTLGLRQLAETRAIQVHHVDVHEAAERRGKADLATIR